MSTNADGYAEDEQAARSIVTSRLIDAPPALVFRAFTGADHLAAWFGPNGFSVTTHAFDFREGGVWDFVMHGPDGTDYKNWIQWQEISPSERLVYRQGEGPSDPNQFTSTITFEDQGESTLLTLTSVFATRERREQVAREYHAVEGAQQTVGRLAEYVQQLSAQATSQATEEGSR